MLHDSCGYEVSDIESCCLFDVLYILQRGKESPERGKKVEPFRQRLPSRDDLSRTGGNAEEEEAFPLLQGAAEGVGEEAGTPASFAALRSRVKSEKLSARPHRSP